VNRAEVLKRLAQEEGFQLAGICGPDPSEHLDFLNAWIEEKRHGSMTYLARPSALARRADVSEILGEVGTVLVVAQNYHQEDPDGVPDDSRRGVIARYARGRDYHRVVKNALQRVHHRFEEVEGRPVPARAYVDTGPILEREFAQRAGLGWFGRNTMLIHPRQGSYFFLGVLLLGVEVEPDAPVDVDHCGSCEACLDACPTSALLGRGPSGGPVMDASRCISYLTIEHSGPIPVELRPLIGNRIYGCDICQEVCPFNRRFAEPAIEPGYAARGPGERPTGVELEGPVSEQSGIPPTPNHPGTDAPLLTELMGMDEVAWEAFSRGSAIRRAGRAGFLRNVAVALGNWGSVEAVPALVGALSDPDALVRGHAAWGLGQVGSEGAWGALSEGIKVEEDPRARQEFNHALNRAKEGLTASESGPG